MLWNISCPVFVCDLQLFSKSKGCKRLTRKTAAVSTGHDKYVRGFGGLLGRLHSHMNSFLGAPDSLLMLTSLPPIMPSLCSHGSRRVMRLRHLLKSQLYLPPVHGSTESCQHAAVPRRPDICAERKQRLAHNPAELDRRNNQANQARLSIVELSWSSVDSQDSSPIWHT